MLEVEFFDEAAAELEEDTHTLANSRPPRRRSHMQNACGGLNERGHILIS
jgi:hypothetical protein